VAVEDVSFAVERGEIFAILGPNGAGKTTAVEIVEGLRVPDRGSVRVLGLDPRRDRAELRRRVGVQLQQSQLPEQMKVWEALDLYSSFYERPADWERLLETLGLAERRNARYGKLSGGQQRGAPPTGRPPGACSSARPASRRTCCTSTPSSA
jgi:ABC-2 type transport system ATP-binding protein